MDEVEVEDSVEQEVVPPESTESHEQEPNIENQAEEENSPEPQEDPQEKNWRAVRKQIAELKERERKKDEFIEKLMSNYQMPQKQAEMVAEEVEEELPDDEYAPVGKVKKLASKAVKPIEEKLQQLERELAERKQQELIQSLRKRYSDFDDVVTPETIAIFEEREPELAQQIADLKDPYKIGMQSYKFIKAANISEEVPGKRRAKEAKQKLEKNQKSLPTPQAYDKRPMAQAFRLTEAEKTKLYNEMMQFGSLADSVPELS